MEPHLGDLHTEVLGGDKHSDYECVVHVDVEVAYLKKLLHIVKSRECLFNATLPFSKMGGNFGFKFPFLNIFEK